MDAISATLRPKAPFDFGQSLAFLDGFPLTRGDMVVADGALTRAVVAAGETVVFRVERRGTIDAPLVHCTLSAGDGWFTRTICSRSCRTRAKRPTSI